MRQGHQGEAETPADDGPDFATPVAAKTTAASGVADHAANSLAASIAADVPRASTATTPAGSNEPPGKHGAAHDQRYDSAGRHAECLKRDLDQRPNELRLPVAALRPEWRRLPERGGCDRLSIHPRRR